MTKKILTDGRTDGRTDDCTKSIVHIFFKCALKIFRNSRAYSWFLGNFFLKNGTVFRAKNELFLVLPKFYWEFFFQKFQKKMVQESWNHEKILKEIAFGPFAGRESLWTTGEKVGFSKPHCEVQKQSGFLFSRPILAHCSNSIYIHMKSLGLDPWPSESSKSPIFPNFEVNLTKYIRNLKSVDYERTLFGPSTSLRRKNCRGVLLVVRLTAIWNCAFHHMEHPQLWSHLSRYPQREIDWFLRKKKKQPLLNFFIHLGPSAHSIGHQNPRLRYQSLSISSFMAYDGRNCRK
jgi:hypothetical protein